MKTNIFLYATVGLVILSCQPKALNLRPTYNKGGFTLSRLQAKFSNRSIVFGQVKDVETNEIIRSAIVKMGCLAVSSDDSGRYKISEDSISEEQFLTCSFIGFRIIETERFRIEKGDSIKIDFFLIQDDRPMTNCEGPE